MGWLGTTWGKMAVSQLLSFFPRFLPFQRLIHLEDFGRGWSKGRSIIDMRKVKSGAAPSSHSSQQRKLQRHPPGPLWMERTDGGAVQRPLNCGVNHRPSSQEDVENDAGENSSRWDLCSVCREA
ncbi:hypothetical protein PDE_03753 [Penicillium oxalicum 114-2]|uniref:Uncharacterized protein n=1 Tax=Penicillium oxalicum (strain 114-2 / CGMCC 5302) TaxID=933388 RepID=S8B2Y2_PENO1|nr:hypothetical protein PDE_03753 [Penicillium oxalicum 114-2]